MAALSLTAFLLYFCWNMAVSSNGAYDYDTSGYTQCEIYPAAPLYNGGILVNPGFEDGIHGWTELIGNAKLQIETQNNGNKYIVASNRQLTYHSPSQRLQNLSQDAKYTLSAWVQIRGAENSALVKAIVSMDGRNFISAGNVIARNGCWSFLKGGFVPELSPTHSKLYFESSNKDVDILVDSVSLQPFTDEEWRLQQEERIRMKRMGRVVVHVTDVQGNRLEKANVAVNQKSRKFPLGSAIAQTILGNELYQRWFLKRFTTGVFENELKWYFTEPKQGNLNYRVADQMLGWCNANGIPVRGHNIFWEDPKYVPLWVTKLNNEELQKAVNCRIKSVLSRYAGKFINWDVSNEMLHFSFYEDKLGPNASDAFYLAAQRLDPWTPMFMNDYNIIETSQDPQSTVDAYIEKLRKIKHSGRVMEGIGLESHFGKPNLPFMRAVLDKLGTLGLPIWLTEVDVNSNFDHKTQATYLEQILREGFGHPAVEGIIMWSALHPNGCYRMCLTDYNMRNLPAGEIIDRLLFQDWMTNVEGETDKSGSFNFQGFYGDYDLFVSLNGKTATQAMSVYQGNGIQHLYVQV